LEGVWARETSEKNWDPYVFLQPLKLATSNLVHNLVLGLAYQKQRFGPKFAWVWARGASKKIWDPLLISATVEASNFKFGTELRSGTSLTKKQRLRPKLAGVWARGNIPKKFGSPYSFLQPLKLATSNLLCNLGFGLAYQKTTFRTKIGGAWARGASGKIWDPLFISATN